MANRALFEKLIRIEKEAQEQQRQEQQRQERRRSGKKSSGRAKQKSRPATVKCVLCGKAGVSFKDTAETPIGRACKAHPGVGEG